MPIVIWSRLYYDLEPYLSWRSADGTALIVFFHTRFNEVAERQFLCDNTVRRARHNALASHFQEEADPDRNQSWKGEVPRPFLHVAFHLASAGEERLDELCQTMCDLRFVEARCKFGQVFQLIGDYRMAQENLPEVQADLRDERVQLWAAEIIEYARQWSNRHDRLARGETVTDPKPKLPQIIPSVEPWSNDEIDAECNRIIEHPTRLHRLRAFARFVESECYPLLGCGERPGFVVQHAFNYTPIGPVRDAAALLTGSVGTPLLLRRYPEGAAIPPNLHY